MSDHNGPSTGKHSLQLLGAELSRMASLRRKLATLEIAHDRQLLLRGAVVGGIGALAAITGLTQLVHASARGLAEISSLSITTWTVVIGTSLLLPGTLLVVHAYRKTRSGFCGLEGTLSELNEDLIWLREWSRVDDRDIEQSDTNGTPSTPV